MVSFPISVGILQRTRVHGRLTSTRIFVGSSVHAEVSPPLAHIPQIDTFPRCALLCSGSKARFRYVPYRFVHFPLHMNLLVSPLLTTVNQQPCDCVSLQDENAANALPCAPPLYCLGFGLRYRAPMIPLQAMATTPRDCRLESAQGG